MLTIYRCDGCTGDLSVGRVLYKHFDSGYRASSSLVCRSCGAAHGIRWALTPEEREQSFQDKRTFDVHLLVGGQTPVKVMGVLRRRQKLTVREVKELVGRAPCEVASELLTCDADKLVAELGAVGGTAAVVVSREPSEADRIPPRQDTLTCDGIPREIQGARTGPTGAFELALQPCAACGLADSLTEDLRPQSGHPFRQLHNRIECPRCKGQLGMVHELP